MVKRVYKGSGLADTASMLCGHSPVHTPACQQPGDGCVDTRSAMGCCLRAYAALMLVGRAGPTIQAGTVCIACAANPPLKRLN